MERGCFPHPVLLPHDACSMGTNGSIYLGNRGHKSFISGHSVSCWKALWKLLSMIILLHPEEPCQRWEEMDAGPYLSMCHVKLSQLGAGSPHLVPEPRGPRSQLHPIWVSTSAPSPRVWCFSGILSLITHLPSLFLNSHWWAWLWKRVLK